MEPARRHVHVLMSTGGEEEFTKLFTLLFNKRLGAQYDFQVCEISHASKFLKYAERERVDICLIILNNIFPDAPDLFPASSKAGRSPGSSKVDQALQIISHLKQKYQKRVLALTGWWPDDRDIATEARLTGADYFDFLPVDGERLAQAMRSCLEPRQ